MTRRTPAPDLIRGLSMTREAPDQVRGGVAVQVNATLTMFCNPLPNQHYPVLPTLDTP